MYTETFDHSIEDKIEEIYPEAINGSPSIRNSSIEVLNESESSSSDSERQQIDVITRDENGENNSPDIHIERSKSLSSSGRKSSSSSFSDLSSDDFFGIDTFTFTAPEPASKSEKNYVSSDESLAKSEKNLSSDNFFGIDTLKFTASDASEPASKSEKIYVSSSDESSAKSEKKLASDDFFGIDTLESAASEPASKSEINYVSTSSCGESSSKSEADNRPPVPTSTYQVYNVAYSPKAMSPTISPPAQVMDRSGRYDSNRIPASIFEINSNHNPLEWSLASNESLFSIHIDQYSFSKDTFKFRESQRSEELIKPVELNMFNQIPSVTTEKIDIASKSGDMENLEALEESFRFKPNLNEDQHDIKSLHEAANSMSTKSSVTSLSCESGTMRHSFVPLNKHSRRSCNFCNCSWGFCHHKGPTCWPSCKCSCGWLFCSCCNSSLSTPILKETEGNSFVERDDTRRQESCKQGSETTIIQSKQTCNSCKWFHCFTCKLSCAGCKRCS